MATPEATESLEGPGYSRHRGVKVSNLGMGTYLGDSDDVTDERYLESVEKALALGCNVLDTAINYRNQRSERVVGKVLDGYRRDEVFVATKGGFIPFDGDVPANPEEYLIENYVEPGTVDPDEVVDTNCLTADFIEDQFERSLDNLNTSYIDLYYVHNPETQLEQYEDNEVERKLREVFEILERKIEEGDLREYGVASWKAFRVPERHPKHMSIEKICRIAEKVSDGNPGFTSIQLPYNAKMTEAYSRETQTVLGEKMSAFGAASELDFDVFVSASLMQGHLAESSPEILDRLGGSRIQRALQFARSPPQVTSALVGSRTVDHVEENMRLLKESIIEEKRYRELF